MLKIWKFLRDPILGLGIGIENIMKALITNVLFIKLTFFNFYKPYANHRYF